MQQRLELVLDLVGRVDHEVIEGLLLEHVERHIDGVPQVVMLQRVAMMGHVASVSGTAGVVVAGAAGTLANAFWIEPGRVDVTRHRVGSGTGSTPVRVAQLSDLHLRAIGHHEERIAHVVTELNPELILITGDAIDRDNNLALYQPKKRQRRRRPATLSACETALASSGTLSSTQRAGVNAIVACDARDFKTQKTNCQPILAKRDSAAGRSRSPS